MSHIFREAKGDDLDAIDKAVSDFVRSALAGDFRRADIILSDAMGDIIDLMMERDCDNDRRISSYAYDPSHEMVLSISATGPWKDFTRNEDILDAAAAMDARAITNLEQANAILCAATGVMARGNMLIEIGTPALEVNTPPDQAALDRAYALVRKRISQKGILVSEGDGWPETDPDFLSDAESIFSELRKAFPGTANYLFLTRDRTKHEDFVVIPCGEVIGMAEIEAARWAAEQACGLITKPLERAGHLTQTWRMQIRLRKEAEERAVKIGEIRKEIGEIEGLMDGLSEAAAGEVRAWVQDGRAFPVRILPRPADAARNQIVSELTKAWGADAMGVASTALHSKEQCGLDAMRELRRHIRKAISDRVPDPAP